MSSDLLDRWDRLVDAHRVDTDVDGAAMHCIDIGQGPTVVLIHGWGDSTFGWHANLGALAGSGYRVIAVDQPGMGRSAQPPAPYVPTVEAQGDRIVSLLDRRGVDAFVPIGHSMGAGVALGIAFRHRDRVERAAVIAAPCRIGMRCRALGLPGMGAALALWVRLAGAQRVARRVLRSVRRDTFGDDVVRGYARAFAHSRQVAWLSTLCRFYFSPAYDTMSHAWENLTARLLIVWGENDRWIPVADGCVLAQRVAGARLVTFPGAGHAPHQERAAEVNRLLIDHLRGAPVRG
jgi:pimeloyl-ACP methyl ester carboxylesterase